MERSTDLGSNRSLFAKAELGLAQRLFRLPAKVQFLLSGTPPIVVDGAPLHHEMQLLVAARRRRGAGSLQAATPELARAALRAEAIRFGGGPLPVGSVRDFEIPTEAGALRVRHYVPPGAEGVQPLIVFFHGGAFVIGDIDTHDEPCRMLCRHAGVQILSVDYRLAPEHLFPAAVDDALAAFRWATEHASELGADPLRIGVGGDSAGGNLAAVVSQLAVRDGLASPAFQILIYPATDRTTQRPSLSHFAEGFLLTRSDIDWSIRSYTGERLELCTDPRISPLLAADLGGLCPALLVTAGFDPLRDEGEAYAAALAAAGTQVVFRRVPGVVHGFLNMTGISPVAAEAVLQIAADVRDLSHGR